jgi:hypothetical protein
MMMMMMVMMIKIIFYSKLKYLPKYLEFQQFQKQVYENLNYLKELIPDYQSRNLENPFKILYDYFITQTENLILLNFNDKDDNELIHFNVNMKLLEYLISECKSESDIAFLNDIKQRLMKYINFR